VVLLFFFYQLVDAVQSTSSVVSDDPASAICIRKTCDESQMSCFSHFWRICLEHSVVMRSNVVKQIIYFLREFLAVLSDFLSYHLGSAERTDSSLKWFVSLKTYYQILSFDDIARVKCRDPHDPAGIHLERTAVLPFSLDQPLHLIVAFSCSCSRTGQEAAVSVIRRVIQVDEIIHVDAALPDSFFKTIPLFVH